MRRFVFLVCGHIQVDHDELGLVHCVDSALVATLKTLRRSADGMYFHPRRCIDSRPLWNSGLRSRGHSAKGCSCAEHLKLVTVLQNQVHDLRAQVSGVQSQLKDIHALVETLTFTQHVDCLPGLPRVLDKPPTPGPLRPAPSGLTNTGYLPPLVTPPSGHSNGPSVRTLTNFTSRSNNPDPP